MKGESIAGIPQVFAGEIVHGFVHDSMNAHESYLRIRRNSKA